MKEIAESNWCQLLYTEDGWLLKPLISSEVSVSLFNIAGQLLLTTTTTEPLLIDDNQVFTIMIRLASGEVKIFKVP